MNDMLRAQALVLAIHKRLKRPPWRIHVSYVQGTWTNGQTKAAVKLAQRIGWLRLDWTGTLHLTKAGLALAEENSDDS